MTTTLATLNTRLKKALGDDKLAYVDKYTDAINDAGREVYPALHKRLDDRTLVTGNNLPNAHFEDWAETIYPDYYKTSTNATATQTTTAGLIRGGANSALVAVTATDQYMYINSDDYPRLLDLMDKEIDFRCWAYPSAADDAFLTIAYTKAGTETTVNSTSTCGTARFSLLEIETQTIPDDIEKIEFRFRVHTNGQNAYFDNARVTGKTIYELLLPTDFQNGHLSQVWLQTTHYSDEPCDDLNPQFNEKLFDWSVVNDGQYLRLHAGYVDNWLLKLVGFCPLENLTADTSTISLDDPKVNLLIAYAKYKIYLMAEGVPSSQDVRRYQSASARAYGEYVRLLPSLRMGRPSEIFRI